MKINHITENQAGDKVVFQGVLEGPELSLVIEVGLNILMAQGALPFLSDESHEEASIIHDTPEGVQ